MIDIEFIPVPDRVLAEMLRLAEVGAEDVVFDLGCGDGRIVVAAASGCGARGVGVDLDAALLAQARMRAAQAGVAERVEFREENLFATDLRAASVITLYLLDSLNVRLRPRLFAQCRPGTRVVSYSFEMGDWEPDAHTPMAANGVSLWMVPANFTGTWSAPAPDPAIGLTALRCEQRYQRLAGSAVFGDERCPIIEGQVKGERFQFRVARPGRDALEIHGRLRDGALEVFEGRWCAQREAGTRREIAPHD